MAAPAGKPSRQTLDRLPVRALAFLRGMGTSGEARAAAATRGYTKAIHEAGWKLLDAACARYDVPVPPPVEDPNSRNALAFAAIDAFDRTTLRLLLRMMKKRAPATAKTFAAREPSYLRVLRLVRVLDDYDKPETRSEAEAQTVLRLANDHGVTGAVRTQLKKHLATHDPPERPRHTPIDPRLRQTALDELYLWLDESSGVARLAIGKRSDLLGRLGLVHRK